MKRACHSSWSECTSGSRPFFWRRPKSCWESNRDKWINYIKDKLPSNSIAQGMPEPEFCERVKGKLKKVLKRGYIKLDYNIKSLTHYFPVPKA